MDLPDILGNDRARQRHFLDVNGAKDNMKQVAHITSNFGHPHTTRNANVGPHTSGADIMPTNSGVMNAQRAMDAFQQHHTRGTSPKKVAFELILDDDSKTRARIPMRVLINPHDTTDSIVTTVKNFYGVYEGRGVSFEDGQGNTLIAKYENFKNDMTVYVRVTPYDQYLAQQKVGGTFDDTHRPPILGEPFQMGPPFAHPSLDLPQPPSRPASRLARKRSVSPTRDRRSASSQKAPSRSDGRSRDASAHGSYQDDANAYSDSDGGHGSTTSSKKARSEQFVTAEISLENIMQDGRRMRPKFESSELPLFVPPQVPLAASTSSISPQRRSIGQEGPSPFARPAQRPFAAHSQMLPSPQSFGYHEHIVGWQDSGTSQRQSSSGPSQSGHKLRERGSAQILPSGGRNVHAQGILPTPDPTIASCISDEDVARQLIALGDASNISHGRTSASTADDAFSGVADIASSTGATSDGESQSDDENTLPQYPKSPTKPLRKNIHYYTSDSDEDVIDDDYRDSEAMIKSEFDEYDNDLHKTKRFKAKASGHPATKGRSPKLGMPSKGDRKQTSARPSHNHKKPRAPSTGVQSGVPGHRKMSSVSTLGFHPPLGADEEDLSSKPRCQRCRKSKKGCDRQRPCQRCKDAGIGIEGCVSEDEVNGRKGRYGRHMGVAVKKNGEAPETPDDFHAVGVILSGMATIENGIDKSKKRKR